MNYFDHKLAKTTAIYGFLTLIIAILSYNFLDIKFATLVHSSELFGTGISTIAAFTSNIFSPKVWTVITAIATVICIYKHIVKALTKLYIMSLSLIMTIIITTIVKVILARYRPEMLLFDNHYGFHFFLLKRLIILCHLVILH